MPSLVHVQANDPQASLLRWALVRLMTAFAVIRQVQMPRLIVQFVVRLHPPSVKLHHPPGLLWLGAVFQAQHRHDQTTVQMLMPVERKTPKVCNC